MGKNPQLLSAHFQSSDYILLRIKSKVDEYSENLHWQRIAVCYVTKKTKFFWQVVQHRQIMNWIESAKLKTSLASSVIAESISVSKKKPEGQLN